MRLVTVLLIAFCSFLTPAFAQQEFGRVEVVVGGSFAGQSFSGLPDAFSTEEVRGVQLGAALRIGNPFYLEPGIGASGSAYTVIPAEDEEDADVLGHWGIRVPVHVGYRLLPESNVKLRVFAGVAPTFLMWVEEDNDFEVTWEDYSSTVWNASFGAGVDVLFLTLSAFYEVGLTGIFNEIAGEEYATDIKMNGIGGSLGIRIAL